MSKKLIENTEEKIFIRQMQLNDLTDVATIERSVQLIPWSKQKFLDCLHADYYCYVLCCDKKTSGYAILSTVLDEAEMLIIAIDKQFQGQGLGRYLLQYIVNVCQQKEITQLLLEVAETNSQAINFYEQFGFQQYHIRKKYYKTKDEDVDALLMRYYLADFLE